MTDDVLQADSGSAACKSVVALQSVDPFEFPRNKLVFLNTVLGKHTGVSPSCCVACLLEVAT